MVYCRECEHYNGRCTGKGGVFYRKTVDIDLNIDCPVYLNSEGEEDLGEENQNGEDVEFLSGMSDPELGEFMGFTS